MNGTDLKNILCDLIRINSINPGYAGADKGEVPVIEYVGKMLDNYKIPYVLEEVLPGRCNLIAKIEGKTRKGICFEAHADTVGVEGMVIPPFTPDEKNGLIYGRGSCDTKGSLASMLHAFLSIKENGIQPVTDVYLIVAVDEELGASGAKSLVANGHRFGQAIIGEPTSLNIVTACKGVARFVVRAKGKSAHSSKPLEGDNAISKMAKLITLIDEKLIPGFNERVHPLLGVPTINVGVIKGGQLVNIVPDECSIQIDRRLLPGETYDDVKEEVFKLIKEANIQDIEIAETLLLDEAMETSESENVVRAVRDIERSMGLDNTVIGVSYCCDGTKFSRAGIPSIILGPGDIKYAHSELEFVPIEECEKASEIYQNLCFREEIM